MEIEGKTLGFLLFCIFTTPVSQEAPQTLFSYANYLPQKRDEAQLWPWLSLT